MPIDPNIPLGMQQQQPMQSLSSLLNVANQAQSMQARQLQMQGMQQQNQQGAIDLKERQALQPFLSDPKNFTDDTGNVDQNKLYSGIMKLAPTTGMKHIQEIGAAQQAMTTAKQQIFNLGENKRAVLGNVFASVDPSDPAVVQKTFDVAKAMHPEAADAFDLGLKMYQNTPADQRPQVMKSIAQSVLPQETQQTMNTPNVVTVDDGQNIKGINTKPGVQGIAQGGNVPGIATQKQLPVGTDKFNPETNSMGYVEPPQGKEGLDLSRLSPKQAAALAQKDPQAFTNGVQHFNSSSSGQTMAAPALGQAQNITDNVDQMNKHFAGLQDQSAGAPLVGALTGNIKSLASKAITGTSADKLNYVNGLLAHLPGFTGAPSTDLKTATDMLEKNIAQLNLGSPASTDAARTLVSAARPNSHMSAEAISEAADQVASQVKASMAMRNVLSSYKQYGDVQGYNNMRQKLEQTADPRIWQYESLPKEQRAAFIQKMQPQDRADLVNKAKQLTEMGILK
jgi:hypothetical protein